MVDAFSHQPRIVPIAVQTVFEGFRSNTRARVREMQLRYDRPITMGHDVGDPDVYHQPRTMRNYRSRGTPWMVVIDLSGHVIYDGFSINAEKFISFVRSELA